MVISGKSGNCELLYEFPMTYDLRSLDIRKNQESLEIVWNYSLVPCLFPKLKVLGKLLKNNGKVDIELCLQCTFYLKSIFCP